MRYQPQLYTYSHYPQRKKKSSKKRKKDYYYSFNLYNPEGTDHLLLTGDILTSYQQKKYPAFKQFALDPIIIEPRAIELTPV